MLKGRPDVNCAVHIHTETGMALAGLKHGLRMVSQQAMRFYQRIGYHPYEGITEDFSERERILKALGQNRALVLHNHGLLTVGKNAREAFILMKYLMSAADHPAQDGGDRRRADRNSRRGLREGGRAVPDPRRRPRLGRLAGLSADGGSARSGLPQLSRPALLRGTFAAAASYDDWAACRVNRRSPYSIERRRSGRSADVGAAFNEPSGASPGRPNKGWSIRHRLMLLALAVALPFMLLTGGIVWQLANNERETRREAILFSTRTLMNAVDTILSKQIAVAQMLATSPALQADDLATSARRPSARCRACPAAGSC